MSVDKVNVKMLPSLHKILPMFVTSALINSNKKE